MTDPIHPNETARLQRLHAASQWLLRMQDPKRTDEQLSEWLGWIDSDPENFAEFERLQRDWIDLNALKADGPAVKPQEKRALREQGNGRFEKSYFADRFITRRRAWTVAAGLAAVVLMIAVFQQVMTSPPALGQHPSAAFTIRAATLPDGSLMVLGAQSRVNMDFNGPKRQLDLSNGEAYFKVRHDKARPFVVQAGEVSVTAVGTAFDVRRKRERVIITVEEGTVEVSGYTSGRRPITWRAEAGYQLTYSTLDRTASLASVDPAAELTWRNGELAYVREPLRSVIEDLNRYSRRKIVIADPDIAALPFTGTVFTTSLDDWLAGVERAYPISVKHTDNGDIVLERRP